MLLSKSLCKSQIKTPSTYIQTFNLPRYLSSPSNRYIPHLLYHTTKYYTNQPKCPTTPSPPHKIPASQAPPNSSPRRWATPSAASPAPSAESRALPPAASEAPLTAPRAAQDSLSAMRWGVLGVEWRTERREWRREWRMLVLDMDRAVIDSGSEGR
ncbi:hypothetical protein P170DRAFT_262596 [Aspergillus steynii IBT 23096]|uniref:Uncharacterized protein n=1 Tax=Aspergillus steynii IBT 23096 TaxID=1392250 RepID=A0A2I2FZY3_9EURO|nr:uncharacterized protein P170DRAFT_262596 [Aspergillus steynii IBT 23096]PLB46190.1 hypothetical protein P170DRAFT_262596 [Aspergillus steynii IBT 23096]